jgi:hypothetical protein
MQCETVDSRDSWFVFVGIRRDGVWQVKRAEQLAHEDLSAVDLLYDFQSTSTCQDDLTIAAAKVAGQARDGCNPFLALVSHRHLRPEARAALEIVWSATARMMSRR